MSSRAFSTAFRRAEALNWRLNGTTQDIEWAKQAIEATIDQIPALASKVDSAVINGDPHPNGDDPLHVSGVIGKRSLKGKNRVTSFHAYPNGVVKFSDKSLPTVQIDLTGSTTPGKASGGTAGGEPPAAAEYWTWSSEYNDHYHLNDDGSCVWLKAGSAEQGGTTSGGGEPPEKSISTAWSEWAWDGDQNQWGRYRMSQGKYEYERRDPEHSEKSKGKGKESSHKGKGKSRR